MDRFDVVVIGGGAAGVVAAIQAARAGGRVMLVEKSAQLGGTTTSAGVSGIQSFFAYGRQVIAGIGFELVAKAAQVLGQPTPDGAKQDARSGVTVTVVDKAVYAAMADLAVLEAGIDLRLHTMLGAIRQEHEGGWHLTLCGKEGLYDVPAAQVIDASGDANAITLAGLPVVRQERRQPATLVMRLAGYEVQTLDLPRLQTAFEQAVAAGEVQASDAGWHGGRIESLLRWYGGNCVHVISGPDAASSPGRTAAEVEGRRVMLRLLKFLRRQPGLERLTVAWCAPEVGVRETVTIAGRATITVQDYERGRYWPDAVCYSFYPIDVHTDEGLGIYRPLPRGVVPTIPYGAMVPLRGRNILAAGRCISGDREAFSAYRVQATCMAVGQAAGAAAALAAQQKRDVADIDVAAIRALLAQHGAIVPTPPDGK